MRALQVSSIATASSSLLTRSALSEFDPAFTAVAKSWATVGEPERNDHFWATLDFDNAQQVFQKVLTCIIRANSQELNCVAEPCYRTCGPLLYAISRSPWSVQGCSPQIRFLQVGHSGLSISLILITCSGFEAGPLAEQLSNHTPVPIPYKAPIDWAAWATYGAFGLFFLVTLPFVTPFLTNKWIWATGTIVTSLIMTSGYMFTRIRGMPMTNGGQWIAAGYQSQYGQETQVVAAICKLPPADDICCAKNSFRWTFGRILPHVDHSHPHANICSSPAHTGLRLDCDYICGLLDFDRFVQNEEPRYVAKVKSPIDSANVLSKAIPSRCCSKK